MSWIPMETTLIENTTMQKIENINGVHSQYAITPNKGYVLHDKFLDEQVIDEETFETTGEIKLGFYSGTRTVAANYDFAANEREFYAVKEK